MAQMTACSVKGVWSSAKLFLASFSLLFWFFHPTTLLFGFTALIP